VVLVAWRGDVIILHDPARAPFQVVPAREFDRAWAATGRWSLLVLPGAGAEPPGEEPIPRIRSPSPPALSRPWWGGCAASVAAIGRASVPAGGHCSVAGSRPPGGVGGRSVPSKKWPGGRLSPAAPRVDRRPSLVGFSGPAAFSKVAPRMPWIHGIEWGHRISI
jgi:hypothetical protein